MWVFNRRSADETVLRQQMIDAMRQRGFSDRTHQSYLSAVYTHRIAITKARILSIDERAVRLRYKDHRDGDRQKVLCLEGEEFVRRFLLHVLPPGLMRVRHFGFLANRCRRRQLSWIRETIADAEAVAARTPDEGGCEAPDYPCPHCGQGRLRIIAQLPRRRGETILMTRRR